MLSESVDKTVALHEQLAERFRAEPARFERVVEEAHRTLAEQNVRRAAGNVVPVVVSALVLDRDEERQVAAFAERLHGLVESAVDWTLTDPDRVRRHFLDHERILPHLHKTPGLQHWQGYSRYDAVLTADGSLRVIELNTGCPGAFHNMPRIHRAFADSIRELLGEASVLKESAGPSLEALPRFLLEVEARAGLGQELVAVLNDENQLTYELPMMVEALERAGRRAVLANAQELERGPEGLRLRGERVTATFNKFRVSTPDSPNHGWRPGFEDRYSALLESMAGGEVASVNNLCALTIAEDKGMMALLLGDEFGALHDDDTRAFLESGICWTARPEDLAVGRGPTRGGALPQALAASERDGFLWKPANEGRGFEVHLGRDTDAQSWERICTPDPKLPGVVQEYVEPLRVPAVSRSDGELRVEDHFLVASFAVIDGRYAGFHVRASPERIVNGARAGASVAVLRSD